MFCVEYADMAQILRDYGITSTIREIVELQRYHYELDNPDSQEVRLIVKVELEDARPLVVRFKNEKDVTLELIESQSVFADILKKNGIVTPSQYQSNGKFARWYRIGGYHVIITVEEFVEGEIKIVDEATARRVGALLARTHSVAEGNNLHVDNEVLFDPFAHNDLFAFDAFMMLGDKLEGEDKALFEKIVEKFHDYMAILAPLKGYPRYAVQGDISDCNMYLTDGGEVGIFDFNRSGDNVLFCDAVMQAFFEARLMDYPENRGADYERRILVSFWEGYGSVRSFSEAEKRWYPYLCALINAFWSSDIRWDDNSLLNAHKSGDMLRVRRWLETIWERLEIGGASSYNI